MASGLKQMVKYVETIGLTKGDILLRTYLLGLMIITNGIRD